MESILSDSSSILDALAINSALVGDREAHDLQRVRMQRPLGPRARHRSVLALDIHADAF